MPDYQREYSWNEENWEEFIQNIVSFIDINKGEVEWLSKQKYFSGDIILKESDESDYYEIIDGQQRLVTIFIFLSVLFKKVSDIEGDKIEISRIKKEIQEFLFLGESKKIRIELNEKNDIENFKEVLGFSVEKSRKKGKNKGNILRAKDYFADWINVNVNNFDYIFEVCELVMSVFRFALIEVGAKEDVEELFMALNNTGLNLSVADLLKTLIIKKIDYSQKNAEWKNKEEVRETWEGEVVGKISDSENRQIINKDTEKFLMDFWMAKFGSGGQIGKGKNTKSTGQKYLHRLFKYKMENQEKAENMLRLLVQYAEVYRYIKEPDYSWWEKSNWPIEFFYVVSEISMLSFTQLFPICLRLYFEFNEKSEERKLSVIKELEILLIFIFRSITIKDKSPGDIPKLIIPILNVISKENNQNKGFIDKEIKEKWLEKELL